MPDRSNTSDAETDAAQDRRFRIDTSTPARKARLVGVVLVAIVVLWGVGYLIGYAIGDLTKGDDAAALSTTLAAVADTMPSTASSSPSSLGRLHLNDGMRYGQQILPDGWAEASATPKAPHLQHGDNPDRGVVIAKSSTDYHFDDNDHETIAAFRAIAVTVAP